MLSFQLNLSSSHHPVRNPEKLAVVQKSLRMATVRWMKMITESNQEAREKYLKDHSYLQKNIWYAEDLLKACLDCKENPTADWIRKHHFQLIGRLPPKYFDKIKDEQSKVKFKPYYFIAKKTMLASDALHEAVKGLSIIDCGTACQIALYGALLDVLEKEKFNRVFSDCFGQLMNLEYQEDNELQPMRHFTRFSLTVLEETIKKMAKQSLGSVLEKGIKNLEDGMGEMGKRPITTGQIISIEGVKDYRKKYPYGVWGNFNVVCCDDTPGKQKFIGLGLNPEGETEAEICDKFLKNYNKMENPLFLSPKASERELWDNMKLSDFEYFADLFPPAQQVQGFHFASPEEFKAELIYDLLELPLEAVSMDFVKQHSEQ